MGKQNLYEHVKPPLIIAGPGVPKGRSEALVYLFDLFPTVCDLAAGDGPGRRRGQEPPAGDQGARRRGSASRCSGRTGTASGWSATSGGS